MVFQKKQQRDFDDRSSFCGSIAGETFVSRGSRRVAHQSESIRNVDILARKLKEYHSSAPSSFQSDQISRFNNTFHNYRFFVASMGGMSVGLMLLLRYGMTVTILRMVNQTHIYLQEHPNSTVDDFLEEGYSQGGEFLWNKEIVGIILAWYMISYSLPQPFLTRWSSIIGCRIGTPISLSVCAFATLMIPHAAYMGWEYVVVCRLINGIGASALLPSMLILLESWMRYDEISFGLTLAHVFITTNTTISPLISGYLAEIHWPLAFYCPAIFTLLFCGFWFVTIANSPESSRFVSETELRYLAEIDKSVDKQRADENENHNEEPPMDASQKSVSDHGDSKVSWSRVFTVPSFYAFLLIWTIFTCTETDFIFILPTYLRQYLKIRESENGFYSSIIIFGEFLSVIWPHLLLQFLQKRCKLSQEKSMVIGYAVACAIVAGTWLYVGFLHQHQLFMFFLNRSFQTGSNDIIVISALMSNYSKIGLSSFAFAIINTVANFSVTGTSTFIGWLLDYTCSSRLGWQIIYSYLGLSQVVIFLLFAFFVNVGPIEFGSKPKRSESCQREEGECNKKSVLEMQTQASTATVSL